MSTQATQPPPASPPAPKKPSPARYEAFAKERLMLVEMANDGLRSFDRTTLTVAGGAFAVSITFLKDVAQKPPIDPGIIFLSWFFFGGTILLTLASFLASNAASMEAITVAEKAILEDVQIENQWIGPVRALNIASYVFMVIAFSLWAAFAYQNLQPHNAVDSTPVGVEDGRRQKDSPTAAATTIPAVESAGGAGAQKDRRNGGDTTSTTTPAK